MPWSWCTDVESTLRAVRPSSLDLSRQPRLEACEMPNGTLPAPRLFSDYQAALALGMG